MSNTTIPGDVNVNFYYVFTIIILCVFIFVAFFGNLIVIIIFLSTKELQTQVNYFLASLALADLLTAAFPIPVWLVFVINGYKPLFSKLLLKIWRCADLTFCSASIWNLCAISIDRCLAVSRPFLHRTWLTQFRVKCALAVVWIYSCMLAILITDAVTWKKRGLLISCLSYYIPTVIIVTAYLIIYISHIKSRFELSQQENIDISSLNNRSKQDLRMAKNMILLIASFLICWAGHFIMGTIMAFTPPGQLKVSRFFKTCIKGMSYLNSVVNPFLYGYVNPKIRVAFKYILCKRCRKDSRHAWTQMSPARGTLSRRTSSTKVATGQQHSTNSQEDAF